MKAAIVGSRTFNDYDALRESIDSLNIHIDEIISGGAKGADSLAERYARENEIAITIFPAEWKKYGRAAGMIRNRDIIKSADVVIAFWDGESKGTKNSIDLAEKHGKILHVFRF